MQSKKPLRVYGTSDIHVDQKLNAQFCSNISSTDHQNDVIVVAGDVSHRLSDIKSALEMFKSKFKHVFFTPGNHCVWLSSEEKDAYADSVDKYRALKKLCSELNVYTEPVLVENLIWIAPITSWYEAEFDDASDAHEYPIKGWGDFVYCKWNLPKNVTPLDFFLSENENWIKEVQSKSNNQTQNPILQGAPVISFSHFLPRLDCMPSRDIVFHKFLPKVVGSKRLDQLLRRIGTNLHLFGHTHINWDQTHDGIRYVQKSLGYPTERGNWKDKVSSIEEMLLWTEGIGFAPVKKSVYIKL